jgi:Putative beta barrel porin-7 (BBP7)
MDCGVASFRSSLRIVRVVRGDGQTANCLEGESMKRILLGLGFSLAIQGGLLAQDSAPAARLGLPGAPVIRAQSPDLNNAAFDLPKSMPKGKVAESPAATSPGTLPVPSAGPTISSAPAGPLPPGTPITGPVIIDPPGTPVPGMPTTGEPMGVCPVPGLPETKWYTTVEALIWYVKSYSVPPLVTVGPAFSGANLAVTGTSILYGNDTIDTNPRYGARFGLGYWLTPCWAVEFNAFFTQPRNDRIGFISTNFPGSDLARPFFSANTQTESSEIIGRPGVASGNVEVTTKSYLGGAELNARRKWWQGENSRLDFIGGFRYLVLEEELRVNERSIGLSGAGALAGVDRALQDDFKTTNRFYGAQVGAVFEHARGPWTFTLTGKVAAGMTQESVNINGSITPIAGGSPPDLPGGLLALASNSGQRTRDKFTVVPELALNVGYDITPHWRVFAGYSFMYWSNVARPGPQIDRVLDTNAIPDFPAAPKSPTVSPTSKLVSEGMWAQGVNFGLLFKW